MQIDLSQSDLATIVASINVQRETLRVLISVTSSDTKTAAETELTMMDNLRHRLLHSRQETSERGQFYWCHAPYSVWDRCHRGCWSGCSHINYTRETAVQHTVSVGDRVTGVILKPDNSD